MIVDISSNQSVICLINIRLISNFFPSLKISGRVNPFLWCSIMNFLFNSRNIVQCILTTLLKKQELGIYQVYLNKLIKLD